MNVYKTLDIKKPVSKLKRVCKIIQTDITYAVRSSSRNYLLAEHLLIYQLPVRF